MALQNIIKLKNQTEYIYLNFFLFSLLTFTNFFLFISFLLLLISFSFLHFSNPIERGYETIVIRDLRKKY